MTAKLAFPTWPPLLAIIFAPKTVPDNGNGCSFVGFVSARLDPSQPEANARHEEVRGMLGNQSAKQPSDWKKGRAMDYNFSRRRRREVNERFRKLQIRETEKVINKK